ncbi:hypothetical protein [Shimia aestuarii]|uniref:hypothetical protein n=1 Tax=Shimia aestuarii TaxID=254406 RepID=UPI001FB4E944|nr:hypothetical protein [Shimia aestuarii]
MSHARQKTFASPATLPTPKQMAYARALAQQNGSVLPWEATTSRQNLSQWIDAQLVRARASDANLRPTSKQVAFAERIARMKRSAVPDECFRSRELLSRWIDSNKH